jgi:hypothetical protein
MLIIRLRSRDFLTSFHAFHPAFFANSASKSATKTYHQKKIISAAIARLSLSFHNSAATFREGWFVFFMLAPTIVVRNLRSTACAASEGSCGKGVGEQSRGHHPTEHLTDQIKKIKCEPVGSNQIKSEGQI